MKKLEINEMLEVEGGGQKLCWGIAIAAGIFTGGIGLVGVGAGCLISAI
jgi:hypothetical protein